MNLLQKLFGVKDHEGRRIIGAQLKELYQKTLNIAWPSTVEGALIIIIGAIDTMMVGTLGAAAIASVGITSQPRMILMVLAQALSVGTTALCARRKGAGDQAGANSCLNQSLAVGTVIGIILSMLGYFGAEMFMKLGGANEEMIGMSTMYFQIISLVILPQCWQICICAALRAIGNTRITMVTHMSANLVNVCLNYVLINGKFGFPALGVKGAAIATAVGTLVGSAISLSVVLRKHGYYHLALPRFDRTTLSGLWKVGGSSIAESASLRLGFLLQARLVAGIGTNAFAAYQIVSQVTSLSFTLGDGAATAGTAMVGQSLGAKRKDQAMAYAGAASRVGVVAAILLMIFITAFARPLAMLFTTEEAIIRGVTLSFYVAVVAMIPQNGRVVQSGVLRGAGDVKFVALCALLSVTILRPALTWLFCYPVAEWLGHPDFAMVAPWIAFAADAFVRDHLLSRRVKKGDWLEIKLS